MQYTNADQQKEGLNVINSITQFVGEASHNVKLAASTSLATATTGTITWLEWIPSDIGKLATVIGLILSTILIYTHIKKAQRGGALLLGVKKPLVIAHGSSNALAIEDAIMFAHNISSGDFCNKYNGIVAQLLQTDGLIGKNNITEKSYLNI